MQGYNITISHFRDIYGNLLWPEPLDEENRLYEIGEVHTRGAGDFRIVRVAIADHIQHVNVEVVEIPVVETEGPVL